MHNREIKLLSLDSPDILKISQGETIIFETEYISQIKIDL